MRAIVIYVAVLLLLLAPAGAAAQAIGLGASNLWTDHAELEEQLGGSVVFGMGRAEVRLAWHGGSRRDFGSACGGFAPPDCFEEPLQVEVSLIRMALGLPFQILERGAGGLRLVPELGLALPSSSKEGLESGRGVGAAGTHLSTAGKLQAYAVPFGGLSLALTIGLGVGATHALAAGGCVDCYAPFDQGYRYAEVGLGAVYGFE